MDFGAGFVDYFFMAIALLTDFGSTDYFVAAMKGVILTLSRDATIVDITHQIPRQDIAAASFCLASCYRDFPGETVFLVVVDPGVGSDRGAIAVRSGGRFFVAPDNGVLTGVLEQEKDVEANLLTNEKFFRKPVSTTFHGRDIFAPVAAYIHLGSSLDEFGPSCDSPVKLAGISTAVSDPDRIEGRVINIDSFGNIVTNIRAEPLSVKYITLRGKMIQKRVNVYSKANPGELIFTMGSAGYIEICLNLGNAAEFLGVKVEDPVIAHL